MSRSEFKRVRLAEVLTLVDSRIQHFELLIHDWNELGQRTEAKKCQAAADELKRLKVMIQVME